jgi:hypothetical protein
MSASTQQPPAHGPQGALARASRDGSRSRPIVKSLLVGSLLVVTAAGCNGTSKGVGIEPPPTNTTTQPATATSTPSVQDAILAQYRAFWAKLTTISKMPAAGRRAALTAITVDPELKSLLAGMAATDAKGQVFYGADIPRATTASISPDGNRAVVDDCQDSSHAGNADRRTGQRLTVGVARNHVVTTMSRSANVWKVYFVSHTKTPC